MLGEQCASEHQNLEFKEAKIQFDNRKALQILRALANEGGGHLLLGIEDQPPRKVVGHICVQRSGGDGGEHFQVLGFRRGHRRSGMHPDGRVLVFHHSRSAARHGLSHSRAAYLMRAGEELVPMSEDQAAGNLCRRASRLALGAGLTDCDDDKVVQLQTRKLL